MMHYMIFVYQCGKMKTVQIINKKLLGMKTAKYGEYITLNKPLLVLYVLSEYKKGHVRMFDYASEVKPNLKMLLRNYGPARRGYATDMPFWRLRHDEFWDLNNAELCSTNGVREPEESELIKFKVSGGFDKESYTALTMKPTLIDELANEVANKFIPQENRILLMTELGFDVKINNDIQDELLNGIISIQRDIEKIKSNKQLSETTKQKMINARVGQGEFREECLKLYPLCPVTGIFFNALLRASHIKPWSHCVNARERLDPHNGIMLAAHIDALFDGGWISFENNGTILKSNKLDLQTCESINLPDSIKPFRANSYDYLEWHRNRVFEKK